MKYLRTAVASAMIGCITSAFGGAGVLTTTVTSLQDTVTYSKPASSKSPALTTYIGYTVSVKNEGGNTINNIRFTGTASATDSGEKAVYSSAEGASCVETNPDKTAIQCTIGQLTAGSPPANFAVFFLAPVDKNTAASNSVKFSGSTIYGEGFGGANSVPDNSISGWICYASPNQVPNPLPNDPAPENACNVALGTFNPEKIRSSVTKNGGDLFTGDGAVTTAADRFSTRVNIPAGAAYTTAEIIESEQSDPTNCTFLFRCDQVKLTIPPPFGATVFTPYLTVVLREDASNIRPGTRIASVLLDYLPDAPYVGPALSIGECATGPVPPPDRPCIAKRTYYKNKSTRDWTLDLDGDFEWTLVSFKNGGLTFRR